MPSVKFDEFLAPGPAHAGGFQINEAPFRTPHSREFKSVLPFRCHRVDTALRAGDGMLVIITPLNDDGGGGGGAPIPISSERNTNTNLRIRSQRRRLLIRIVIACNLDAHVAINSRPDWK